MKGLWTLLILLEVHAILDKQLATNWIMSTHLALEKLTAKNPTAGSFSQAQSWRISYRPAATFSVRSFHSSFCCFFFSLQRPEVIHQENRSRTRSQWSTQPFLGRKCSIAPSWAFWYKPFSGSARSQLFLSRNHISGIFWANVSTEAVLQLLNLLFPLLQLFRCWLLEIGPNEANWAPPTGRLWPFLGFGQVVS